MGLITKPKTWVDNENVLYTDLNNVLDTLYTEINGNLDNSNLKAGAAIDVAKVSGTALNIVSAQTVTGQKTFVKPVTQGSVLTITSDDSGVFDAAATNYFERTLDGTNGTLSITNVSVGQPIYIRLLQDGTGSRTVTFGSGFTTIKWVGGAAPTLTTTAAHADLLVLVCRSAGVFDAGLALPDLS